MFTARYGLGLWVLTKLYYRVIFTLFSSCQRQSLRNTCHFVLRPRRAPVTCVQECQHTHTHTKNHLRWLAPLQPETIPSQCSVFSWTFTMRFMLHAKEFSVCGCVCVCARACACTGLSHCSAQKAGKRHLRNGKPELMRGTRILTNDRSTATRPSGLA